jgi:putative chitinase
MLNRDQFFAHVSASLFAGHILGTQQAGITIILDEWDKRGLTDLHWLAYMLATAYWECDRTMQSIREVGGSRARYAPWYGRGFVQLTWQANYAKASKFVGVDLIANPDLALSPPIAVQILFDGMLDGWFTGKKLSDYNTSNGFDYVGARHIINGNDRDTVIAGIAGTFFYCAIAANQGKTFIPVSSPALTPPLGKIPGSAPEVAKPLPATTAARASAGVTAVVVAIGGAIAATSGAVFNPAFLVMALCASAIVVLLAYLHLKGK